MTTFVESFTMAKAAGRNAPVAVFDSGVGGISVLRQLCELLPGEDYWYYGDSANAPYGTKHEDLVRELTAKQIERMIALGAKAVVLACNTATSAAAPWLRERHPGVPIIGMEPEIKTPALAGHRRILVMATPMTLQLQKFRLLFERYKDQAEMILLPCPGLSELIERGPGCRDAIAKLLDKLLAPCRGLPVDAVVLGCTHYLHIKDVIREVLRNSIVFYDGAAGAARELRRRLDECGQLNDRSGQGEILIENSSDSPQMIELCRVLLGL